MPDDYYSTVESLEAAAEQELKASSWSQNILVRFFTHEWRESSIRSLYQFHKIVTIPCLTIETGSIDVFKVDFLKFSGEAMKASKEAMIERAKSTLSNVS